MHNIKTIIDLGNGYIKGIVISSENGRNNLLHKDMIKTKGMRKGKILDTAELADSIKQLIENIHKKLGGDYVDEVYIGVSHPDMIVQTVSDSKRIMGDKIESDDMTHLYKLVSESSDHPNYELIKTIPAMWIVDDQYKATDPLDMTARKLEIVANLFFVPRQFYKSIIDVLEKLEIGIADMIPNILASSELVLDYDSKDLGCVLIDIGNNQTSRVVYENGVAIHYGNIAMGGEDVTKDLSIGLQIDLKQAETIKIENGDLIENKVDGDTQMDTAFLHEVISSRYEEILDTVHQDLIGIQKDGRLAGGVVLVGGGCKMPGLEIFAKDIFRLAIFMARDRELNMGDIGSNLIFINTLAIYHRAVKYEQSSGRLGGFKFKMGFGRLSAIWKFIKDIF